MKKKKSWQRVLDMADGTDSCAPSVSAPTEPEDDVEKLCGVCKVPISTHVGKPGVGKCLGGAFTKAFETLVNTVAYREFPSNSKRSATRQKRNARKRRIGR